MIGILLKIQTKANFVKLIANSIKKKFMKITFLAKTWSEHRKYGKGPIKNLNVSIDMGIKTIPIA